MNNNKILGFEGVFTPVTGCRRLRTRLASSWPEWRQLASSTLYLHLYSHMGKQLEWPFYFRNYFNACLTSLGMTLCAAGGCPSFSARVTSTKYAAALKKRSWRVANYTSLPVHFRNELFKHAHKKVKRNFQDTNLTNFPRNCLTWNIVLTWMVYCSWSLWLLLYSHILNSPIHVRKRTEPSA